MPLIEQTLTGALPKDLHCLCASLGLVKTLALPVVHVGVVLDPGCRGLSRLLGKLSLQETCELSGQAFCQTLLLARRAPVFEQLGVSRRVRHGVRTLAELPYRHPPERRVGSSLAR